MTTEEFLDAMLDGWTADQWIQGDISSDDGVCLVGRARDVRRNAGLEFVGNFSLGLYGDLYDLVVEVIGDNWPDRINKMSAISDVTVFNDHADTSFDDVRVCVEKARALAGERGL